MPCRDDYPETPCEDAGLRRSADAATRAACDMRTILRRHSLEHFLTPETRVWIHQHDIEDARRIKQETEARIRENTRLRALEKLSLEERRVLGL